jgi:2'-5' RNA ligase
LRLFFGIPVDEVIRERVAEVQEQLRATQAKVKWVEPANFHFTLRFIGEVPDQEVEEFAKVAEGTWGSRTPQDVLVRGVGVFTQLRRPRVIWVGVHQGGELISQLHEELSARLAHTYGGPEEKSFTPHLTIGRVKALRPDNRLTDAISEMSDVEVGVFRPDRFVLYQSRLARSGASYRVLRTYGAGDDA